jgi:hypothetical protein
MKHASENVTEKVIDFGENVKDKTEVLLDKLDTQAADLVDKLEEKIRGNSAKTDPATTEPIVDPANATGKTVTEKPASAVEDIEKEKTE